MDVILMNGKIITMDVTTPECEAVAFKGGRIVKVGNNEEILSLKSDNTEIIDLERNMVVPGFNDSHMHLLNYGYALQKIDLTYSNSIEDLIEKGKAFLDNKKIQKGKWILGRGWNQDDFNEKRFPTKYDLDKISTQYPICYTRTCGHAAIVNSKALEIAGITKETAQVEGGKFDLDINGEPLGIFRENALELIYSKIPTPTIEEIKDMILTAAKEAVKDGITSIQTDDFEAMPDKNFQKVIRAYKELKESGELPIRIYQQCLLPEIDKLKEFLKLGYKTGEGDEYFKFGPIKLLCDGSLGARTAYMTQPYADDETTCGIYYYSQEDLEEMVVTAHDRGMQIAVHCIGDKAMYMAIDSFEKALQKSYVKDHRHGIIHCQITDEILLDKFKKLNLIAYIQPIFLDYDLHIVEERVGKNRAKTTYNWKGMVDRGIHIACGSDCPVESFNIMKNIYSAVTRKDLNGYPKEGWLPEQRLTVYEALYGFTLGAAFASFEENIKGTITPRKLADMVVLSKNIFEINFNEIKDVEVLMTFIGGKLVYKKS
ncbi:amidohydrolase [Clostridium ganghwense]|uniref:Amidohydrolase n=1 Tax=Clostridium ganghwense TaxID=312089 RepID=A0ABT4CJF8_9CLOT|nr:amidohydrolase [Clostridium ganghwense]MCY6369182.1 amidohydrolase [Clostridium ganghwense]